MLEPSPVVPWLLYSFERHGLEGVGQVGWVEFSALLHL